MSEPLSNGSTKPVRCDCGRLLVRKTDVGYELKCPRCKRFHILPYDPAALLVKDDNMICPIIKIVEDKR